MGYLLSRVIHDWDDETSIAILKVVRNAIAPEGKLLLLETMMRPGQRSLYPLLSDLNMMLRTGGSERTEEEYRAIYRAAGFELTRTVETISPTGATIVEGKPASVFGTECQIAAQLDSRTCSAAQHHESPS